MWHAKYLIYAARLQLINVVLVSISSYWCQMFILPKKILKEVNNVFRTYLWHRDTSTTTPGNVSWAKVCSLKKFGGLGVRNLESWNLAAIGKIACHVSMKHDSLWVKLIHEVYMKGGQWKAFNPPITSSWAFKKMCHVKEKLWAWMEHSSYAINEVYQNLHISQKKVTWAKLVWSRTTLPKTRFILYSLQQAKNQRSAL